MPQACALLILVGSSGAKWNTELASVGSSGAITANRFSFFALEMPIAVGFAPVAADFYVYYPANTSRSLIFLSTWSGLWLSLMITSTLLLQCYDGLGGLGGLCVVLLALGNIANTAPATYAAATSCQVLGRYAKAVPRWTWCPVVSIELVCSVASRNDIYTAFENLLPIMSYWIFSWLAIILEEHLLFHMLNGVQFDWTVWEDRRKFPCGVAALTAWLTVWAGAIIGMYQVWFSGPIAQQVGG